MDVPDAEHRPAHGLSGQFGIGAAFGDLQQYVAALLREMATLQASHRDAEEYARSLLASNELLQASAAESATYASSLEQELAKQRAAHSPDTSGSCR